MNLEQAVVSHYALAGLAERVMAGIAAAGLDVERLRPEDLAPVDEFHTGGRLETVHALKKVRIGHGDRVIDVGCGIGGTARHLACTAGCRVTGIDLTPEYIELARLLSQKTGLADRTEFITASALDIPCEKDTFDAAITFHAAMNIADRPRLYGEIARVLKRGATLCVYDVLKIADSGPLFPVPWAEVAATSHLRSLDEMHSLLEAASFKVNAVEDRTEFAIEFFRKRLAASDGPPSPLGLHLLTGANAREKFENYLRSTEQRLIAPTMIVATLG